jgi:hypothetical protein
MRSDVTRSPIITPHITSRRAQLAVIGLVALLATALLPRPTSETPVFGGGARDQSLHTITIARLHAGDPYYVAVGDELRRRHFPTASPFNWRTPLLFSALAMSPSTGRVAFIAFGVLVLGVTVGLLHRQPPIVVVAGALAQSGAIGVMFDPHVWVFHEIWAGYLIGLSVFAYLRKKWTLGAVLGIVALFVRELTAPYAIVCGILAAGGQRRRELSIWILGGLAYCIHYGWHVWQVAAHQRTGDIGHATSWLRFGGVPFVVDTLRTNSILHDAPAWLTASALVLLVSGLLAGGVSVHMRWTVIAYMAFFAVVGQTFNWYWGWLPGFVVPLVFAHGIPVAWALLRRATTREAFPQLRRMVPGTPGGEGKRTDRDQ